MAPWKILITDGLEENGLTILRTIAQTDDQKGVGPEKLLQIVHKYDALVVRSRTKVTASVIRAGQQLKVIGRAGVGVDNIDLAAARSQGIKVVHAPKAATLAVAELTLGLMLALARSIPLADHALKLGQWIKKDLHGVELSGKTLGVIGVGKIGAAVAQRAASLGMITLGYDPQPSSGENRQKSIGFIPLAELYARSDFITLHPPLTPRTCGMIDARALEQMKPGVRIICTARGGIIDEQALLKAIETGKVAGAALDVFAQEPPKPNPLVSHPNVITTPHIGAQTIEAQKRVAEDIANEVLAALQGKPLKWEVA